MNRREKRMVRRGRREEWEGGGREGGREKRRMGREEWKGWR